MLQQAQHNWHHAGAHLNTFEKWPRDIPVIEKEAVQQQILNHGFGLDLMSDSIMIKVKGPGRIKTVCLHFLTGVLLKTQKKQKMSRKKMIPKKKEKRKKTRTKKTILNPRKRCVVNPDTAIFVGSIPERDPNDL